MTFMFCAYKKFDSRCGDSWLSFVAWSGLHHICEIVSTDETLCPSLIDTLIDEDWNYNFHADYRTHFFHNYEYLKRRVKYDSSCHNILALTECPDRPPAVPDNFMFCGYDILDSDDSISVLVNCGEFPSIFTTKDINQCGLLNNLDRAAMIAETIRKDNPDDRHCCDCRVWGISRYTDAT